MMDCFDERIAASYREVAHLSEPEVFEPTVSFLAELAGMRLRERWRGWKRAAFTVSSRNHVPVWEKAPEG
ncbi:MAG TPA: hypothetical protein VIX15_02190 [Streptosporangiaceae bacterium]